MPKQYPRCPSCGSANGHCCYQIVREAALEEAAVVCEETPVTDVSTLDEVERWKLEEAAGRIRALKCRSTKEPE